MRSARHDERVSPASIDRAALTDFVDACQVLVGRLDVNPDASTTVLHELLTRVLQRASGLAAPVNFRVARVLSYLEDVYADQRIRLASAARHVDVTPSHLDRLLKEHTGLTFLQQLRRIRMRHAERLLLTTTLSIKETAFASGYTCTGSFHRDFRRMHGCAPRAWRDIRTASPASGLKFATRT
jgi:AraC-like DNA-binding protein